MNSRIIYKMQLKNIKDLSIQELKNDGFIESTYKSDLIMLIPKNKLNIVEYGTELYSVDGEKIIYDKNSDEEYIDGVKNKNYMDKDIRWGVYAWGIKPKI